MNIVRIYCVVVSVLLLAGCAAAPKYQALQPGSVPPVGYVLAQSSLLEEGSYVQQSLSGDNRIQYFQNFGGGGLGVGLLFGPLGTAANMAMIDSATQSDAKLLRGKIAVDPTAVFVEVTELGGIDVSTGAAADRSNITPYLYISKTEGDTLLVASALILERGEGAGKWVGKYMYQLPLKYNLADLPKLDDAATAQLRAAVADGFAVLLRHIGAESQEKLQQERKITFKSDFMNPRFDYEMYAMLVAEEDEIVWVRSFTGVYGVRRTNITLIGK